MPNWCENSVILKHNDPKKIAELKDHLLLHKDGKGEYFFNFLRPRPESEGDNWYNWNVNNWGTKWDADPQVFDIDENNISLDFSTAWSPPIYLYDYLTEQGWDVEALYSEPGMCFCGSYTSSNPGDECYNYDLEDPSSYEDIPDEVFRYAGIDIMLEEFNESNKEAE